MVGEIVAGHPRRLARAALRRGAHAHGRGCDRAWRCSPPGSRGARRCGGFTFGFRRAEILSAQLNGATLVALAVLIAVEAIQRLIDPPDVDGLIVLVVAHRRHRGEPRGHAACSPAIGPPQPQRRGRLPARAHRPVRLHRHGDRGRGDPAHRLLARGWHRRAGGGRADAALGLRAAARLRAACCSRPPRATSTRRRSETLLAAQNHVVEVHDLHVWEVTSGFPAISAHVTVRAGCDTQAHRRELADLLRDRFGSPTRLSRWRRVTRAR